MKKRTLLMSLMTLFVFTLFTISCNDDPEEYCEQDDICGEQVTACCTDDDGNTTCVWKYDGKEYTDIYGLYDDLNCESSVVLKSAETDVKTETLARLLELMDRAHAGLLVPDK
ncbi:MAG: hypothetical protein GXO47_01345 [Chlorobi bacterium]|nr:hypothetical protein [Chlorobiota bacterium]